MSVRALVMLAAFALGIYGLDQLTKQLVVTNMTEGETIPVLGELFQLHFVLNPGAAFSLASGYTWVLTAVAVAVIVGIIVFARRIRSVAWAVMIGLLLGGALGNATDRLFREPSFGQGHVVDMFQIWGFPAIFNVADVAIVTAMGLFILLTLRGIHLDGTRDAKADAGEPVDPAEGDESGERPAGG